MKYDVVIIGAGPGGIFSAYELMKLRPELKVVVLEAGQPLEKRKCPIDGKKIKNCIHCKSCGIMNGFGVHFQMENIILRISLVVLCMNILVREKQSI